MTYGCPPRDTISEKSIIVEKYSQCVNDYLKESGGVFKIPDSLGLLKAKYITESSERREMIETLCLDLGSKFSTETKIISLNFVDKSPGLSKWSSYSS